MSARARKLITMDAAADWLGVSKRHVRRLISSGQLPAYRISEAIIRIDANELEPLLAPVVPHVKD